MRKLFAILSIVFIFILFGCKQSENSPEEALESYISLWDDAQFSEMYSLLTETAKDHYTKTSFSERYEKIYNDLHIENVDITYEQLSSEQLKAANDEKTTYFHIDVTMDSLAGPITYTHRVHLVKENQNEEHNEENWFIDWDPSLIFPDLDEDSIIQIEKESPRRGEILDRNRMPLAINSTAYEIGIVPELFIDETSEKQQISTLLNMSIQSIDEKTNASWVKPNHFVPLKVLANSAEYELEMLKNIPSISMRETTGRIYPAGKSAAHLTGYIGQVTAEELAELPAEKYNESDMIGKSGLELLLEDRLRGEEGVRIIIVKENNDKVILAEQPAVHGENIELTIDINVQETIFNAYGEYSGTAAALQPKTGEVLALISSPAFDPNDFIYGISNSKWESLLNDEQQPLINRFTSTYAPGSVIKPITAAIGVESGVIKHEEELEIIGHAWKKPNWSDFEIRRVSDANEKVDLKTAIVQSDNIYFAMKGIEIGDEQMVSGFEQYAFNESLPLIYPFSTSRISNSGHLNNEVLRANTSYGQGEIEVSSLHLATMYSTFINDGNMIKPILFEEDEQGEYWKENIIDQSDARMINQYLREVVSEGTAKRADDEQFAISGKTGTAELKLSLDTTGQKNSWFVGYPTNAENMIIAMMLEDTDDDTSSSHVAELVKYMLLDTTQ